MEKDVLESMPPAQRTSYEVSRRKALGMAAKLGLGGAAAAALGAGVGTRSVREALAAGRFAAEGLQDYVRQPCDDQPVLHTDSLRNRGCLRVLRL